MREHHLGAVARGGETIDVLHLLDRLEEAISTGWKVPFTSRVAVNEQDLVELSDSIRSAVPEELRQAQQVLGARDSVLAEAESEARRILEAAQEQAHELVSESGLRQQAERQAQAIMDEANERAREVREDADRYALDSLKRLETALNQTLATVRNGIEALSHGPSAPRDTPAP
ncbi:MAG: vacuolar-type H+-ATPase subunit H [Chloroflexota bacterium]